MIIAAVRAFFHEITMAFNPGEWVRLLKTLRQTNVSTVLSAFRGLVPQFLLYYILLSPYVAAPLYNMMLFHPSMTGPFDAHQIVGRKIENVLFKSSNGTTLHGWYLEAANSKNVVLISHGNGGNITNRIPLIAKFLRDGKSVFIYDYQGYGRSHGSPSVDNICVDGEAAFSWLLSSKHYHDRDIIVFGESLGTGVTCQIAARHKVAAIILQSAYSSLLTLARQKLLWLNLYPDSFYPKAEAQLNNATILAQRHAPLLLVHGERDRLIPFEQSKLIFEAAVEPKELLAMADAGHNDILDVDETLYDGTLKRFLNGIH